MRKLIFQEWLSMDGFAADVNNNLSFLESESLNKYSDQDVLKFLDGIDTILLGAITYRLFVEFWPDCTTEKEIIADRLNEIPKVIFSKTLTSAPWGKWPAAKIISTDAGDAIKKMKKENGKDMVLWGSISLAQDLMKQGLIDEYHLRICPLVLGGGRPLFENTGSMNFELFDTKFYEPGLVLLKYRQKS